MDTHNTMKIKTNKQTKNIAPEPLFERISDPYCISFVYCNITRKCNVNSLLTETNKSNDSIVSLLCKETNTIIISTKYIFLNIMDHKEQFVYFLKYNLIFTTYIHSARSDEGYYFERP